MHCTRNIKFCGFKPLKKSKKHKRKSGEDKNNRSHETNSSSGVISDLSDFSQAGIQYATLNRQSYLPFRGTNRNSCLYLISSNGTSSNLFPSSNDTNSSCHTNRKMTQEFSCQIPSDKSIIPFPSRFSPNESNLSISSVESHLPTHFLPMTAACSTELGSFKFIEEDILSKVFQYLPVTDLCRCARVCKYWYTIVWNQNMWNKLDMSKCIGDSKINIHKGIDTILKILSYRTYPYCSCLTVINLSKCQISNEDLSKIATKCRDLEAINLSTNLQIQDASVCHLLTVCLRLKYLNLSKCVQISDLQLSKRSIRNTDMYPRTTIDNLRHLDVSYCPQISDMSINQFGPLFRRLKKLILKECRMITDNGLRSLLRNGDSYKYLDISGCSITDKGISIIIENFRNLRQLSISKCQLITNKSIHLISKSNHRICKLEMRNCFSINFSSLQLLENFRLLDLSDNCHLTKQQIRQIAANNKYTLEYLIINKFDNLSKDFLREIFKICIKLKCIDVKKCTFVDLSYFRNSVVLRSILTKE